MTRCGVSRTQEMLDEATGGGAGPPSRRPASLVGRATDRTDARAFPRNVSIQRLPVRQPAHFRMP